MALITVVIPCFNAEKYITRCIAALERQTRKDFEVICIDDGSTDNTAAVISTLQKNASFPISLICNENNIGPAKSRNKGILEAESEYLCFCDADDWYDDLFIESMLAQLEAAGADLAFCGYKVVDEAGNKTERPLMIPDNLEEKAEVLSLDVDSLCMMMVKTSLMQDTLLPDFRNGEDMAVIPLLMVKASKCVGLSETFYNYFRRSGSASQNSSMLVVDSLIKSFDYIRTNFPIGFLNELEYLGIRNLLYAGLITLFSFSFDIKKANEILDNFELAFPHWIDNPTIGRMPKYKQLVLHLAYRRNFLAIKCLAIIRNIMTRK